MPLVEMLTHQFWNLIDHDDKSDTCLESDEDRLRNETSYNPETQDRGDQEYATHQKSQRRCRRDQHRFVSAGRRNRMQSAGGQRRRASEVEPNLTGGEIPMTA